MVGSIQRNEAIQLICKAELSRLTCEQRAEHLSNSIGGDWESDSHWSSLPAEFRDEYAKRKENDVWDWEFNEPDSDRYDPMLMLVFAYDYLGVANTFLLNC
ncbi:hypothetical protein BH11PLA2_BH11PLA2_01860 [soil metagenome]